MNSYFKQKPPGDDDNFHAKLSNYRLDEKSYPCLPSFRTLPNRITIIIGLKKKETWKMSRGRTFSKTNILAVAVRAERRFGVCG